MTSLLLQIPNPTDSLGAPVITEKTLSVIDLITSGGMGGNLVMGALGLLSIFAIYILIERFSVIKKASKEDENFLKSIQNFVKAKDIAAAKNLCRNTDSPISRMIEKGVNRIDKPMTDISAAIENQGKLEVYKMENNLANLATISGAAPMIGFLGTVIGMIVAFHEMASAGGNIDVEMLSKGIYTAMTTTVAGLVVGIIAFIAYNYLVSKVDKVVFMLEATTTEFMDLLHNPISSSIENKTDFEVLSRHDVPSKKLNIISFIIPLAGLIIYLLEKDKSPKKANSALNAALWSIGIGISGSIILYIIVFAMY